MRGYGVVLAILLLLVGCGKNRPWPATIVGIEGFSPDQKTELVDAMQDLNKRFGHDVVVLQNTSSTSSNYPITIKFGISSDASQSGLAGVASVSSTDCLINISPKVFTPEHPGTAKPVLWHELGHCAGLLHDPTPGEIMYKSTNSFDHYGNAALAHFYHEVVQSAGLPFSAPETSPMPSPTPTP